MKFKIKQNLINKALFKTVGIIDKKGIIPSLSNVKIEAKDNSVIFVGTDMDIIIKSTTDAAVEEGGSTTVQAHILHDIIKKIPDGEEIKMHLEDKKSLKLSCGKSHFSMPTISAEDFPSFAEESMSIEFLVNSQNLMRAIDQTRFAVSNDETRRYLNGIFFQITPEGPNSIFNAVAIDGHKLALSRFTIKNFSDNIPSIIVPKKTIGELKKIIDGFNGDVKIRFSKLKMIISCQNDSIASKIIDADFPDYQKIIPKENNLVLPLMRKKIFATIDRVATMVDDRHNSISMTIKGNKLIFSAITTEGGAATEELDVEAPEMDLKIAFNARYLLEIINQLNDEKINFRFKNNETPVLIDSGNDIDAYVIMPIRL
ncbi:DNA polymerase III subunit beta [Flavobacteriaceae bacterium]|nr:DNA polymerase III subunit beta [Flavobacteriaceae bacterium]